ncbi:MAG: hypothetical protein ACRCZP_00510 [Phycicoccus sp.]
MSNSGAALTWTLAARRGGDESGNPGTPAILVATVPSARTGMTVTSTSSITGRNHTLRVYVCTGASTADPLGAVTEGSTSGTNVLTTTALVTEQATSLLFVSANESDSGPGNPTSSNTTADAYSSAGNHSGLSGHRAATAAGASETFNVDAAGAGLVSWNWVAVEIRDNTQALAGTSGAVGAQSGVLARAQRYTGTSAAAAAMTAQLLTDEVLLDTVCAAVAELEATLNVSSPPPPPEDPYPPRGLGWRPRPPTPYRRPQVVYTEAA